MNRFAAPYNEFIAKMGIQIPYVSSQSSQSSQMTHKIDDSQSNVKFNRQTNFNSQLYGHFQSQNRIHTSQTQSKGPSKGLPNLLQSQSTYNYPTQTQAYDANTSMASQMASQMPFHVKSQIPRTQLLQSQQLPQLPQSSQLPQLPQPIASNGMVLRSVTELPLKYRSIFSLFPCFNVVQSTVFDDVLNTDKPLVVCSPTGSGKTVIFELAIVRLLMKRENDNPHMGFFRIVYIAPLKVLCTERFREWEMKFGKKFGLKCIELTGDSEIEDYDDLRNVSIIMTTPEKWDSISRNWRENKSFINSIHLVCIDEVHLIGDGTRGATLEAVISRMKTVRAAQINGVDSVGLRFIAVSATAPNVEDISLWLGNGNDTGISYKMGKDLRPVKLDHHVIGYPCKREWSDFRFDIDLSYKLDSIIRKYSNAKPTLVFCSSRKSVEQTTGTLKNDRKSYSFSPNQKHELSRVANNIKNAKLRDVLHNGVGFHHAGLDLSDRHYIEEAFISGILPVLISTSTLAMGVNLPAHLVIVKSTSAYYSGAVVDYSESQLLQMIGRAGRPQYDTSATAVIMTKDSKRLYFESLLNGTQIVESNLHKNLVEHLNAEIVLKTITDIVIAMEWIRSTFFYIRVLKNPQYYGIYSPKKDNIDEKVIQLCKREFNGLNKYGMIMMDDDWYDVKATDLGKLMAKYCISLNTMKKITAITGDETIGDMIALIASCEELTKEVQLRVNERKVLNELNKNSNFQTIRYPMKGKIKTAEMKVNCLIQAAFGCLPIQEVSMNQDLNKIMRAAKRISKCFAEIVILQPVNYTTLFNAIIVSKCFKSCLWHDSQFVTKQLQKIGSVYSSTLADNGFTSFKDITEAKPQKLEMILNRNPPFGSQLQAAVNQIPNYSMSLEQIDSDLTYPTKAIIKVTVKIENPDTIKTNRYQSCYLIVGDDDNRIMHSQRLTDAMIIKSDNQWTRNIEIDIATNGDSLYAHLISEIYSGIDVICEINPKFKYKCQTFETSNVKKNINSSNEWLSQKTIKKEKRHKKSKVCAHTCYSKETCAHSCCKIRNDSIETSQSTTQNEFKAVKLNEIWKTKSKSPPKDVNANAKRIKKEKNVSNKKDGGSAFMKLWLERAKRIQSDQSTMNKENKTNHNESNKVTDEKFAEISDNDDESLSDKNSYEFLSETLNQEESMLNIGMDDALLQGIDNENMDDDQKIKLKSQDIEYAFDDDDEELLNGIPNEDFQDFNNELNEIPNEDFQNFNKMSQIFPSYSLTDTSTQWKNKNTQINESDGLGQWSQILPKIEMKSQYFT